MHKHDKNNTQISFDVKLKGGQEARLYIDKVLEIARFQTIDELDFNKNVVDKIFRFLFNTGLIQTTDKGFGVLDRVMYSHNARPYALRYAGELLPYHDAVLWLRKQGVTLS